MSSWSPSIHRMQSIMLSCYLCWYAVRWVRHIKIKSIIIMYFIFTVFMRRVFGMFAVWAASHSPKHMIVWMNSIQYNNVYTMICIVCIAHSISTCDRSKFCAMLDQSQFSGVVVHERMHKIIPNNKHTHAFEYLS